jgi:NDP-sugar pyrophosphorylase family protein
MDVLVLAGGQGTRLRTIVSDRPKTMALINGRPFLDMLIGHLGGLGFYRFILCVGYMAEFIQEHYADTRETSREIAFSREAAALGTGGAVKNAEPLITSSSFLVFNGDSFCPVDLHRFIAFHRKKGSLASMVLAHAEAGDDFGSVTIDPLNKIIGFQEKKAAVSGWINAGVYLFEKKVLSRIPPDTAYSLEQDLFPQLAGGDFYGFPTTEKLVDIGTPGRFTEAQRTLRI